MAGGGGKSSVQQWGFYNRVQNRIGSYVLYNVYFDFLLSLFETKNRISLKSQLVFKPKNNIHSQRGIFFFRTRVTTPCQTKNEIELKN